MTVKVVFLFYLFFAPLSECLQGNIQPNKIWKLKTWNGNNKLWRTFFGLKNEVEQNNAASGFKVQGTARLNNGKVKLDLTMQGPNKNLRDPYAQTLPTSATTGPSITSPVPLSTVGSPSPAGTPTTASTSATSIGPPVIVSTTSSSATTLGPTTPAGQLVPTTSATTASAPTSSPTNMATSVAPTTLGTPPTSAGPSLPTLASPATTVPVLTSAQPPSPAVTAATTLPTTPISQTTNSSCVKINIYIVAKEVLKDHNAHRRTHGSPDLHLDGQMNCDAQKFAQEIAFKGVLQHQSSEILESMGENIGMSCAPVRDGPLSYGRIVRMAKNVAKRWYDEVCQYNFDQPKAVPSTGHFTEIVWSGSRKLGVGYAVGKNARFPGYECVYVVGRYKPAGNIIGGQRLKVNVKRGSFNGVYCQRRSAIGGALSNSVGFHGGPWDKRNHLKHKESETARLQNKERRKSSFHHTNRHMHSY